MVVARRSSLVAAVALTLACSVSSREEVATSSAAIRYGTPDVVNPASADVAIKFFGTYATGTPYYTPAGSCSGVLVTPTRVLTANHCITGDALAPWPFSIASIVLGADGAPPPLHAAAYSLGPSAKTIVRYPNPVSLSAPDELAIVELDTGHLAAW